MWFDAREQRMAAAIDAGLAIGEVMRADYEDCWNRRSPGMPSAIAARIRDAVVAGERLDKARERLLYHAQQSRPTR